MIGNSHSSGLLPSMQFTAVLLLALLVLPTTVCAQWDSLGVYIPRGGLQRLDVEPDGIGGAWFAYASYGPGPTSNVYVQRVDEDGFLYFDGLGVYPTTLGPTSSTNLFAAFTDPDGNYALFFSGYGEHQDTFLNPRFQKVSPEGTLLCGDNGWLATSNLGEHHKLPGADTPAVWAASDGQGGGWCAWKRIFSYDLYINGVNADGSLKLTEDIYLDTYGMNQEPFVTEDGTGGCYITWGTSDDDGERLWVQRFRADGSQVAPAPVLVIDRDEFDLVPEIAVANDHSFAYVGYGVLYQKVDSTLTPQWPLEGVLTGVSATRASTPLLHADNSVSHVADLYDEDLRYGRLTPSGELLFDNHIIYESDNTIILTPLDLVPDPVDSIFYVTSVYDDTDYNQNTMVTKLTTSGNVIWGGTGNPVFVQPVFGGPASWDRKAVRSDDNHMIHVIGWTESTRIWRMNNDGEVDGVESAVPETGTANLPSRSELYVESVFPMPFNHSTNIVLNIPDPGSVSYQIYDITGRRVYSDDSYENKGRTTKSISLDHRVSSGILIVQITQGTQTATTKLVLLK